MSSIDFLCRSIGIDPSSLPKEEVYLLEIILFFSLCEELSSVYHSQFKNICNLLTKDFDKDHMMIYGNVINLILQDLIKTDAYTLKGVAMYAAVPEEIIYDIAAGLNTNPSLEVSRKIFELHRVARVDLYQYIINKITNSYFTNKNTEVA